MPVPFRAPSLNSWPPILAHVPRLSVFILIDPCKDIGLSGGSDKPHLIAVRNVELEPRLGAPVRIDMITREPNGDERT